MHVTNRNLQKENVEIAFVEIPPISLKSNLNFKYALPEVLLRSSNGNVTLPTLIDFPDFRHVSGKRWD